MQALYFADVPIRAMIAELASSAEGRRHKWTGCFKITPSGWRGTNFLLRDPAIIAELERKMEGRLHPIPTSEELVQPIDAIKNAEIAIRNAELETTRALRKYIAGMEAPTFEMLVSILFMKLGYKKVAVTPRTGDGGIDVKADFVFEGVGNIKTCIQAKRQQNSW
jgi:Restriction endonuclease